MNKYLRPINYYRFFLGKVFAVISPIIRLWESYYLKQYGGMPLKHQPVFIIGAPRTGSTILYQTLTNQLDVLYIDNLAAKFYKNLFWGFWLSNKLFKKQSHNCFSSDHGTTKGLHSPSECGAFWYRWLPADRHFIDFNDITDTMVEEIRQEITALINYFNKPIVFKNLNAGQRLRLLQKCFPEAKFIFIKRNPLFVAQSTLNAKRKLGIQDTIFWSVMPKNVNHLEKMNAYEQIIKQIYFLEKQIVKDSQLFLKENFLFLNYENFTKDCKKMIELCQNFIEVFCRKNFKNCNLVKARAEKLMLSSHEVERIKMEIDRLDWGFNESTY